MRQIITRMGGNLKTNVGKSQIRLKNERKERRLAYLLLLPAILAFAVFMFWPVIYTLYLSFFKWNMISPEKTFVGIKNYVNVFNSSEFKSTVSNTLLYIVLFIVMDVVIPYLLAFSFNFVIKKMKSFYKVAYFVPYLISLVVGGIIMSWIWNSVSGPLAAITNALGMEFPNWAITNGLVIVVIALVVTWKMFGYNFIILIAAIDSVPLELIETARLENTPNWEIFFKIVLPMTSSTGIYALILSLVWGLQWSYTPLNVLTAGGPNNLSTNIIYEVYEYAFNTFSTGSASALSVVTLVFFAVLLLLEIKFVEKGVYYEN